MPVSKPVTTQQIMMYGHVASALRKFLKEKGWKIGDLNKALGKDQSYSAAYQWVNGKSAPNPETAKRLSKITGIPADQLVKRTSSTAIVTYKPSKHPIMLNRPSEVLVFGVTNDGNARIKVDIVLPLDKATPLLRMLLDAGLVFAQEAV